MRGMFKIYGEPESPHEGGVFKVYGEPESPDEATCLINKYINKKIYIYIYIYVCMHTYGEPNVGACSRHTMNRCCQRRGNVF